MADDDWPEIYAKDLTEYHVGHLVRVNWNHGHTITGRLAVLTFEHETTFYTDGSKKLGDRFCTVTLEVGTNRFEQRLPLNAEIDVQI